MRLEGEVRRWAAAIADPRDRRLQGRVGAAGAHHVPRLSIAPRSRARPPTASPPPPRTCPMRKGFAGMRSWLVEGCRVAQPLEAADGREIGEPRPPARRRARLGAGLHRAGWRARRCSPRPRCSAPRASPPRSSFRRSSGKETEVPHITGKRAFLEILKQEGVDVHVRQSRHDRIAADGRARRRGRLATCWRCRRRR